MADDVTLTDGQKGNFDDLMKNAVDPSDVDNDQWLKDANGNDTTTPNPRFGKPRFLSRTLKHDSNGNEYWEAKGKDGKIYKVESDEPPKEPKKGKITIT